MIRLKVPESSIDLPISGKKVRFRALTAGDEKLFVAESERLQEIAREKDSLFLIAHVLDITSSVLSECVLNDVDVKSLYMEDYLFLLQAVRIFSIGEKVSVRYRGSCGHWNTVNISLGGIELIKGKDVADLEVETNEGKAVLKLQHPIVGDVVRFFGMGKDGDMYPLVAYFDGIYLESGDVVKFSEMGKEELDDFLSSIPASVLQQVKDFADGCSYYVLSGQYKCSECGEKEQILLRGIVDFF